ALVFETEPLENDLEILGPPVAELEISSDRPVAMIAARLSDVLPEGPVTRVTYGLLNLTHRESHENPAPLEPGKRYRVRVQLNDIAQRFPTGHRLRLSLSTSYWPLAWTPPERTTLTLHTGESRLVLPVRPDSNEAEEDNPFAPPEAAPVEEKIQLEPPEKTIRVVRDLPSDRSVLEVVNDDGRCRIESIDLEARSRVTETYSLVDDDPDSVRGETYCLREFRRGDWHARTETRTVLASDAEKFYIHATLDAWEGEERVFSRNWKREVGRDLV
ncbi:MAG: CocE/NonD family hydrolase C-terminal non-catalytic domain-containing protein, partial [Desulfococcaceae bacterium]